MTNEEDKLITEAIQLGTKSLKEWKTKYQQMAHMFKTAQADAWMWEQRYNEQTKLAASYFTNPVNKECVCEWPDKTLRKVMVTSLDRGIAHVIWNERHDPIDGQGCVVGMEDTVSVAWLYIPAKGK